MEKNLDQQQVSLTPINNYQPTGVKTTKVVRIRLQRINGSSSSVSKPRSMLHLYGLPSVRSLLTLYFLRMIRDFALPLLTVRIQPLGAPL